ncbi:MAG: hypothetical protein DCC55_16865 [Chloroflexi bacterium]|nr:MAG: hypothetical protein DCC55_16865 [Chloroflexota bacterium]
MLDRHATEHGIPESLGLRTANHNRLEVKGETVMQRAFGQFPLTSQWQFDDRRDWHGYAEGFLFAAPWLDKVLRKRQPCAPILGGFKAGSLAQLQHTFPLLIVPVTRDQWQLTCPEQG